MKKTALIIALIILAFTGHAQNAIAKIRYEQAEEAFSKNDFVTTLSKLDEAQKLLGAVNPKILYLRLMAQKNIIARGKYDYDFLAAARKDADYYVKKYSEVEGIEEKFREVFEFAESLEALPKTKELYDQKEALAAQQYNEWLKVRPVQVSDSLMNAYKVKRSASLQEFLSYNPGALSGLRKFKHPTKSVTAAYDNNNSYAAGPASVYLNDKGLFLYSYIVVGKTTDTAMAKKVYRSLIDLYPDGLDKEAIVKQERPKDAIGTEIWSTSITPAATGNKGSMLIFYVGSWDGAYVQLYFYPQ